MKNALVTGAGKRLGRAMALYLGARGYNVAVHYAHSEGGAEATVSELRTLGSKAVSLQADLLDEDQLQGLVSRAASALDGPITCLVNNASIFENDSVLNATKESWDRHLGSNLRAPFVLVQELARQDLPELHDDQGERIASALVVNMIDQRVRNLSPDFMTYTIAKSALWTMTRTTAQALGPLVRVNAIGPGPTLRGAHQSEEEFARERASTLLSRGANPSDITAALGYLLEAKTLTGQLICIDGGQHLEWRGIDQNT